MSDTRLAISLAVAALLAAPIVPSTRPAAAPAGVPSFAEPAISPDRSEIAFVSGGDIWSVPVAGGEARLLVAHAANETRPLYSPDGKQLAFVSTRTGNGDVYLLAFATGDVRRLTFDDAPEQLDSWSRDGKWLYYSTSSRDIAGMNDVLRVSVDGGTPMPVTADRYASEYWAAPSPADPRTFAFTAKGLTSGQWWRNGHSHIDESEIWILRLAPSRRYEKIAGDGARNGWPMWSADGRSLFYVSDRDGHENVWVRPLGGTSRAVTSFRDGRVLWPTISYDGRTIVFERDFAIWTLDPASGASHRVPITLRGASASTPSTHLTLTSQFQSLALSPDGRKVAFVAHGEVFAAPAKEGGDAARVTTTPGAEAQLAWAPDSRRLAYAAQREGVWHLYLHDFGTGTETQLTTGGVDDLAPTWSPDGNRIAFYRDGRELRLLDVATKRDRPIASGSFGSMPFVGPGEVAWSPDGRWLAYRTSTDGQLSNLFVVRTEGCSGDACRARQVSFLPNVFGGAVAWSADGTYLLFTTGQRTENGEVARVDLVPRTPHFREDRFRDLFREEPVRPVSPDQQPRNRQAPDDARRARSDSAGGDSLARARADARRATPEPVFDGIRTRLSLLPLGLDVADVAISPDGKSALLTASAAGQRNLYVVSLADTNSRPAVPRQITSTPGNKGSAQWSPDSREIYFLENGRISVVPVESRQARSLAVTAELDVAFDAEKMAVFEQAWSYLDDNFFDPGFNGVDWRAVRAAYAPRVAGARTTDEMRRVLNLMVGELNASHSGIGGASFSPQTTTGRLGVRFDADEYDRSGKLRVSEVVPLSPAALGKVAVGDYLVAVNGAPVGAHTNLDSLLTYEIDRRVELSLSADADGRGARTVAVRPVALATEKGLLYRAWVEDRRAYVERISNGRLGYVHMPDMGAESLEQLQLDLDAQNRGRDGVVIDVRNNNGGFVNAYALDVLARRGYMTMTYRGMSPAPARTVLGQRALERPTVLVTNMHSLSDAEDFTEGYRALKLGSVVGEPTAGWIIYTSNAQLLDGTSVRLPFIRIRDGKGADMELHPRPVDVLVERPIGESYGERDSQLDAAVRTLLAQIGRTADGDR